MGENHNKDKDQLMLKKGKIYVTTDALNLEEDYAKDYKERLHNLAIQLFENNRINDAIVIQVSDVNRALDMLERKKSHRWDDIFLAIGGALIGASIQHILTLINQISLKAEPITLVLGILGLFILILVIIKRIRRI